MSLNGESVRFVANLLQQVQSRIVRRQMQRRFAVGENYLFQSGFALGALRDTYQFRSMQALFGKHFGSNADLSLAAVDDQQVRRRILAGKDARSAARQRLAQRSVFVPRRFRLDVEAPVLAGLHRQAIEDDTARDRGTAHGVTDVEAFDSLR